jgi:HPt (histidine-containing phosphotransfer) domain-containing protein
MSDAADFNDVYLRDIAEVMSPAEFRDFVARHVVGITERVCQLEGALAKSDLAAIGFEAHKLIASLGTLGLARAAALSRDIEDACKAGQTAQASDLLAQLRQSTERGFAILRNRFLAG